MPESTKGLPRPALCSVCFSRRLGCALRDYLIARIAISFRVSPCLSIAEKALLHLFEKKSTSSNLALVSKILLEDVEDTYHSISGDASQLDNNPLVAL